MGIQRKDYEELLWSLRRIQLDLNRGDVFETMDQQLQEQTLISGDEKKLSAKIDAGMQELKDLGAQAAKEDVKIKQGFPREVIAGDILQNQQMLLNQLQKIQNTTDLEALNLGISDHARLYGGLSLFGD